MKKRSLAVLMAGVMAASMMTGIKTIMESMLVLTLTLHRKYATISDGNL